MVCNLCNQRQPVGASCAYCSQSMARYYCSICHLFDDKEGRDIYHCPSCNVCRRGKVRAGQTQAHQAHHCMFSTTPSSRLPLTYACLC